MAEFKVGDTVKVLGVCTPNKKPIGKMGTLVEVDASRCASCPGTCGWYVRIDGDNHCIPDISLELLEPQGEFKAGAEVRLIWEKDGRKACKDAADEEYDGVQDTLSHVDAYVCFHCPNPTSRFWMLKRIGICWPESHMELVEEAAGKETDMSSEKIGTWAYEIVAKAKVDDDGKETLSMRQLLEVTGEAKEPTRESVLFKHHKELAENSLFPKDVEVNIVRPFVRE